MAVDPVLEAVFVARGLEPHLARRAAMHLEEGVLRRLLGRGRLVRFDPNDHPRDRLGRFVELLKRAEPGDTVVTPEGARVDVVVGSPVDDELAGPMELEALLHPQGTASAFLGVDPPRNYVVRRRRGGDDELVGSPSAAAVRALADWDGPRGRRPEDPREPGEREARRRARGRTRPRGTVIRAGTPLASST